MSPDNEDRLRSHIGDAIMQMKKEQTVACSLGNLKQITSTRGLTCHLSQYHGEFDEIATSVAKTLRFRILR